MKQKREEPQIDSIYRTLFDIRPQKGDLKRFAIVDTAVKQLARNGVEKTNFGTIAKELKTIRAHIAYYFDDMYDLVDAAIKFSLGTAQGITVRNMKLARTPQEKLEASARSVFEWARVYRDHAMVFILLQHLGTVDESRKSLHSEIRKVGRDRISQILRESRRSTKFSAKKIQLLSHQIQNIIFGNIFEILVIDCPFSLKEQEEITVGQILALASEFL